MVYSFGEKLHALRKKSDLSQEDLAIKLNAKYSTSYNKGMISKWERGKEEPRMEAVRNIANFFNVTLDEFLGLHYEKRELPDLNSRDERDIAIHLEKLLSDLENQNAMSFYGEEINLDEESKELLKVSLEQSMRLAKQMAKKKFTPKKFRD